MVTNASGIPASRVHPMADGESLPGPRARSAAGKHARDLDTIASDETGLQRCPRQLRKLLPLGRRQVARHATSRKAATAAFNPHSAPPPERRFSVTRSLDYRSRGNAIANGSMGAPRPPVKRLSALWRALHSDPLQSVTTRNSTPKSGTLVCDPESRGFQELKFSTRVMRGVSAQRRLICWRRQR